MSLIFLLAAALALFFCLAVMGWCADRFCVGLSAWLAGRAGARSGGVWLGLGLLGAWPDALMALGAASQGHAGLALGSALGSSIGLLSLVLGVLMGMVPLALPATVWRLQLPILGGVILVLGALLLDQTLSALDGAVLVLLLAAVLAFTTRASMALTPPAEASPCEPHERALARPWCLLGHGLGLTVGALLAVVAAIALAQGLGLSDYLLGLTVVALGMNLPELLVLWAVLRRCAPVHPSNEAWGQAVGGWLGAGLIRCTLVVALCAWIAPGPIHAAMVWRDGPVLLALVCALWVLAWVFQGRLTRVLSPLWVGAYLAYGAWVMGGLFVQA